MLTKIIQMVKLALMIKRSRYNELEFFVECIASI